MRARVGLGMAVIGLGAAATPLDISVNVAFPAITEYFRLDLRAIQWTIVCYVLAYGGLMLVAGRLGDLYRHRRVFRVGLALSAAALAACALAESYPAFLAARVAQGIGSALLLSSAPALATLLVGEERRTWAIAIYGAMAALATAIAPLVGGLLVAQFGWQGVYWFRVPICLLALLASATIVPRAHPSSGERFDFWGAAMLVGALAAIILALALARDIGWPALAVAGLGAVAFAGFVHRQNRSDAPIIRPGLFSDWRFAGVNLASIMVNGAGFSVLLLTPYFMARIGHLPALGIGFVLAVWASGTVLGTLAVPRLVRLLGMRALMVLGVVLLAAGLAATGQWGAATTPFAMAAILAVQGFGQGLFQVVYMDIVMATLPVAERGVAASLAMLTRTLGTLICATIMSAAFAWLQGGAAGDSAFIAAFAACFTGVAALLVPVAGLLLLALRGR